MYIFSYISIYRQITLDLFIQYLYIMFSFSEDTMMLMKRKMNISVFTALAAALLLLATEVFAGHHGENQADIVHALILLN